MRILRWFWGIVTLLACGWIAYGFMATSQAFTDTVGSSANTSEAYEAGATIGAGLGIGIFLCTGLPVLLVAALLYWRNGVGMEREKEKKEVERRHQEQLAVMQSQIENGKRKNE